MPKARKLYSTPLLFAFLSIVFYISFGYDLDRSDFTKLISLYAALFSGTYLFLEKFKLDFWRLAILGTAFRLILIPAIPNLSQDFYRFLWDGRVLLQGVSPYLFPPHLSPIAVEQSEFLIKGMGDLNASHFSNYPPINQLFFALAALFCGKSILGSVIILRILIIFADIGILYFGKKILEGLNLPIKNIFWYFLNPFIIIELTGNLHFEGVMLFFFVLGMYQLMREKWVGAAALIGISISVKLLPLLVLPLIFKYFTKSNQTAPKFETYKVSLRKLFLFYLIVGMTFLLTFLPFLSREFILNFSATLGLWFQNFEFNASIYYIIRWIGFQVVGWNIIGSVGKILPVITLLFILWISIFRPSKSISRLVTAMLFAISFYFLLSTTVHPWYIATPLLLSVFTKFRFPIVWSLMVMLSYSAYGKDGFDENLWLVTLEYTVVIGIAVWEIFLQTRFKPVPFSAR